MTDAYQTFLDAFQQQQRLQYLGSSSTSVEAVDGDASYDSMGEHVVSQWRDVFDKRGRREVDLIVTKKITGGPQIPLIVVEIKRDNLNLHPAMKQIEDYLLRIVSSLTSRFLCTRSMSIIIKIQ